jgi:FkbM family methyltransferase
VKGTFTSYAQNFEDLMLYRALEAVECGFYIDIGAQHPEIDSVSRAFFERGWTGVHVEPVPEYAQMLREARPGDVVLEAAVSSEAGEIVLEVFPATGLSTVVASVAAKHVVDCGPVNRRKEVVPTLTLAMVAAEVGGRDVHWLKIDVEGHEKAVLEGWRSSGLRPWICVVESMHPNSTVSTHLEWEHILHAEGYECVYLDGLNRFYVASEHADRLRPAFQTPPNVFDNIQLGEHASMCRELVARYETELRDLTASRHSLMRQLTETDPKLVEAMKASASWRLTAPLRALADIATALFGWRSMTAGEPDARGEGREDLPKMSPATRRWLLRIQRAQKRRD